MINKGCEAIGIVCLFKDAEDENLEYSNGIGVDPVGGIEAIISHDISMKYKIPCAHSPAFTDYQIYPDIVNPKSASEYITPTFLPCILIGLSQAPKITTDLNRGINISDVDYLVMPHDCLGSTPVFEALERNITVYAVRENSTTLNVTKEKLFKNSQIIEIDSYKSLLEII